MGHVKTEEEYNACIISLLYDCPLYKYNPDCLLMEVRKKGFEEKFQWINRLTLQSKQSIYQDHMLCFAEHSEIRKVDTVVATGC